MDENMVNAGYGNPVSKLLVYGEASDDGLEWPDYLALGLTHEHIFELIRMIGDEQLHQAEGDSLLLWAPVHAWRALGQLKAVAAVDALIGLFRLIDEEDDDWAKDELPQVMAMIGPAAISELANYFKDTGNGLLARIAAERSLELIGQTDKSARAQCVAILVGELQRFPANKPVWNAFLIDGLIELKAVEAIDCIRDAFAQGRVALDDLGDIEDVEIALGLRVARTDPRKLNDRESFVDSSREVKIGRNEPCYCGSGKKYKKCCLAKDDAVRFPVSLDLTEQEKAEIVRNSQKYPVKYILINQNWKNRGYAAVLLFRLMDETHYIFASYLIDIQCLGVKNASCGAGITRKQLDAMVARCPEEMDDFCIGCAQQLVSQAVEYARNLGIEPHPDFELAQHVLGNKEDCEDRQFKFGGSDGKPLFVAGPEDDQQAILDKLTARLGKDGFNYILPVVE